MRLPTYTATRYVVPLREGGSLPAVLDTDEAGAYVVKFRGAGQGAKALLAELLVGLLAVPTGLPIPEVVLVALDAAFGRTERDPEIQDILKGSRGLNVGLAYLDGAFNYEGLAAADLITPAFAADLVWFDAFCLNVDRTPRNPNLLVWDERVWLIDHGAALYLHHDWPSVDAERARTPFAPIRDHVLLPLAGSLEAADERMTARLRDGTIDAAVDLLPDELLMDAPEGTTPPFPTPDANRDAYRELLRLRLEGDRPFVAEAVAAQRALQAERPRDLPYRR